MARVSSLRLYVVRTDKIGRRTENAKQGEHDNNPTIERLVISLQSLGRALGLLPATHPGRMQLAWVYISLASTRHNKHPSQSSTSCAECKLPTGPETVTVSIDSQHQHLGRHQCRNCLRPRSARFHVLHVLKPGTRLSGWCRSCRQRDKVRFSDMNPSTPTSTPESVASDNGRRSRSLSRKRYNVSVRASSVRSSKTSARTTLAHHDEGWRKPTSEQDLYQVRPTPRQHRDSFADYHHSHRNSWYSATGDSGSSTWIHPHLRSRSEDDLDFDSSTISLY